MLLPIAALLAILSFFAPSATASESPQVAKGREIYTEHCEKCHGADGQKGEGFPNPIWGPGAQIKKFEHVQALFEYMQMLMPFDDPKKIDDEARWNVIAYMLQHHKAISPGDSLDPGKAASVPIK